MCEALDVSRGGYYAWLKRERLMNAAGRQARLKRRRVPFDLGVRQEDAIAPNVLDRDFEAYCVHAPVAHLPCSSTYPAGGRRRAFGSINDRTEL